MDTFDGHKNKGWGEEFVVICTVETLGEVDGKSFYAASELIVHHLVLFIHS